VGLAPPGYWVNRERFPLGAVYNSLIAAARP